MSASTGSDYSSYSYYSSDNYSSDYYSSDNYSSDNYSSNNSYSSDNSYTYNTSSSSTSSSSTSTSGSYVESNESYQPGEGARKRKAVRDINDRPKKISASDTIQVAITKNKHTRAFEDRTDRLIETITKYGRVPTSTECRYTYCALRYMIISDTLPSPILELLRTLGYSGIKGLPEYREGLHLVFGGGSRRLELLMSYLRTHKSLPSPATKNFTEKSLYRTLNSYVNYKKANQFTSTILGKLLVEAGYSDIPGIPNGSRTKSLLLAIADFKKHNQLIDSHIVRSQDSFKELADYVVTHKSVPNVSGKCQAARQFKYLTDMMYNVDKGRRSTKGALELVQKHRRLFDTIAELNPKRRFAVLYRKHFPH